MKKNRIIKKKNSSKIQLSDLVFDFLKDKLLDAATLTADLLINPAKRNFSYSHGQITQSRIGNYLSRSPYFKKDGENYIINEKGRLKIIKSILSDKLNKKADWSGYWWAVVFDIPEKRKTDRNLLRRELKTMHFIEAQKSIWITPYDVEKELLVLLSLWLKDFKGSIKIFKVEKIFDDKDFKNVFGIG